MSNIICPQPGPQTEFMMSPADIVIYGGSAGGGKSHVLVLEAARNAHVPGYSGVLFRRTTGEIRGGGSIWEKSQEIYSQWRPSPASNETNLEWTFASGAKIRFAHLQHEKDKLQHQGKEYAFIGFDELTHFTSTQFWYLVSSRLRSTTGIRPYVRCTTNPDPDSWVRKLIDWWIDPVTGLAIPERSGIVRWFVRGGDDDFVWADSLDQLRAMVPGSSAIPMSLTFIRSTLDDNKILLAKDPQYKSRLESLSKIERERLLGGNWNIKPAAGLYYKEKYFDYIDEPPHDKDVLVRVRAWDKAATEPTAEYPDPDWTVGVKYSMLRNKTFVIEDVVMVRKSPKGVNDVMLRTAQKDGPRVHVHVWQDPGQAGKNDVYAMQQLLMGFVLKAHPATKDKETNARAPSAAAENGLISIVRGPWNSVFVRQLEGFPDLNKDDCVDGLSLAHNAVTGNKSLRALMGVKM